MAFNTAALKGLFSKLKPAAKTVANYGDDVASAVANYGDDAAKALTTYGDDAARMAFANADDLAAATAQTDDIADIISKERPFFSSAPVEDPVIWDNDYLEWYDDKGINTDFRLNGARTIPENTDELVASLDNLEIMDDIDTTLQFGKPISNFSNTSSYIDQMVSPTPNWTSRWGELEPYDDRLKSLYSQLREDFDRWTDFKHSYGFTPPHVNYDDLADQIMKLESLRDSGRWWKGPLS
jgi:hypothetical protein